jgi:hypothetical protein
MFHSGFNITTHNNNKNASWDFSNKQISVTINDMGGKGGKVFKENSDLKYMLSTKKKKSFQAFVTSFLG